MFLASLSLAIERQVQLFKPQELANSLWGFAMLRYHPGPSLVTVGLAETRRCGAAAAVSSLQAHM